MAKLFVTRKEIVERLGVEIDQEHFATARARLENELRQGLLPLFGKESA